MAKRKNGERTRGVMWLRGAWWIRWTCTLGHKHRKLIGDNKDEARQKVSSRRVEVRRAREENRDVCPRVAPKDQPLTFGELLHDYCRRRDLKAQDDKERQTRRRKEHARIDYLRARFGPRPIRSIGSKDIETLYEDLKSRTVGKNDDHRPISVATVNRYMKLLHAILRLGVKRGLLQANPAASMELARENNARSRCLNDDEQRRLMAALPDWFRPLVVVAILTGMRRGELLGLRWTDLDFDTGSVRIRRDKAGDGRWTILNAEALDAVRTMKRARSVLSPFVFCTPEGKSLNNNFNRYWAAARTAAQLVDFRFHDLRHTFASRLVRQGVSSYVVQHAGGWRTASMMARYAHLDPRTIRAAVELLTVRDSAAVGQANGHHDGHRHQEPSPPAEVSKAITG